MRWPTCSTNPRLRVNIMREMAAHMTDALTRVRELVSEQVGQRLAPWSRMSSISAERISNVERGLADESHHHADTGDVPRGTSD